MIGWTRVESTVCARTLRYWAVLLALAWWQVGESESVTSMDPAGTAEHTYPFRCGMSTSMLAGFNENDAKASLRVWIEAVGKEHNVPVDPNVALLNGISAIRRALTEKSVDGVVVGIDEYQAVRSLVSPRYFVASVSDRNIYAHYLLLVHQSSSLTNLENLRGHTLYEFANPEMSLAGPWLDSLLMQKRLPVADACFGHVAKFTKLTKVILPVFFRQADACLVTRKGFEIMVELNPQVGQQLRTLASSPKLIPLGFFIRASYPASARRNIVASATQMNATAAGRQVLTVFHTDHMVEQPLSSLSSSLELLDTYHRLLETHRAAISPSVTASTKR